MTRRSLGLAAAGLFVGTVWFANWLLTRYGVVHIGFGLTAPAGVFAVGLAFTLRDVVHRTLGRAVVVGCILAGCLLAYLIEATASIPGGHMTIAAASALAFLFSETTDLLVYTPLEERSFVGAVAASNVVGAVVDSALFLWLAFGSLAFMEGQVVGKLLMTAAALPVVVAIRPRLAAAA
jgi:queuosine precursor transporter